jgi:hypothetical protein
MTVRQKTWKNNLIDDAFRYPARTVCILLVLSLLIISAGLAISGYRFTVGNWSCDKQAIDIKKNEIKK